jgi:hypothetical protein
MMTDQSTVTVVGAAPTSESSHAPTGAQALIALRRVEIKPASAFLLGGRTSTSSVEQAKALYRIKTGRTRL